MVGRQVRDGETLFIIEADGIENRRALEETASINRYFRRSEFPLDSFSGAALVTENGVVREMEATIGGQGESGPFVVNTSDIGSTTVASPSWKSTVREQEATFDVTRSADGNYVELRQTGGQPIDGTGELRLNVGAFDGSEYYDSEYGGSTSAGTTFYLYKTDETTEYGGRKLGISKNSRPSASPTGTWSSRTGVSIRANALPVIQGRSVD